MGQPLAPSAASAYPVAPAPGLFDAFGGQTGIRSLMDDFVSRLKADPRWPKPSRTPTRPTSPVS
jgi:hemoglobin